MSETSIPFDPPSPTVPTASEPRRVRVRVDASGVKSTFVNTVKASTTPEVVVVEMGFLQVLDGAGLAGGGGGKSGGRLRRGWRWGIGR